MLTLVILAVTLPHAHSVILAVTLPHAHCVVLAVTLPHAHSVVPVVTLPHAHSGHCSGNMSTCSDSIGFPAVNHPSYFSQSECYGWHSV